MCFDDEKLTSAELISITGGPNRLIFGPDTMQVSSFKTVSQNFDKLNNFGAATFVVRLVRAPAPSGDYIVYAHARLCSGHSLAGHLAV